MYVFGCVNHNIHFVSAVAGTTLPTWGFATNVFHSQRREIRDCIPDIFMKQVKPDDIKEAPS